MAKAILYNITDSELRRLEEQKGLDTLLVLAVTDNVYTLSFADMSPQGAYCL